MSATIRLNVHNENQELKILDVLHFLVSLIWVYVAGEVPLDAPCRFNELGEELRLDFPL